MKLTDFNYILSIYQNVMKSEDFEETKDKTRRIYATFLDNLIEDAEELSDDFVEKETLINDYGAWYEQQGFVNGFRWAIRLSKELL